MQKQLRQTIGLLPEHSKSIRSLLSPNDLSGLNDSDNLFHGTAVCNVSDHWHLFVIASAATVAFAPMLIGAAYRHSALRIGCSRYDH